MAKESKGNDPTVRDDKYGATSPNIAEELRKADQQKGERPPGASKE